MHKTKIKATLKCRSKTMMLMPMLKINKMTKMKMIKMFLNNKMRRQMHKMLRTTTTTTDKIRTKMKKRVRLNNRTTNKLMSKMLMKMMLLNQYQIWGLTLMMRKWKTMLSRMVTKCNYKMIVMTMHKTTTLKTKMMLYLWRNKAVKSMD